MTTNHVEAPPREDPLAEPPRDQGDPAEQPEDRFPSLDWKQAFATDFTHIDWLPGRFIERGQQVAIVGDGKVGKSLFAHDWLWRAVTGRSFLGDERRDPLRVLYFDRENGLRDVVTRMQALGATPDELEGFDYRMFPRFSGGLDAAPIAVQELLRIVSEIDPHVVIFDTVSRFITGKENDSDTWLQFYGRVHAPLKGMGVAGVRLDHMGKDAEKGSRGSSAKSQDVDHVWEMTRLNENHSRDDDGIQTVTTEIKLKRTHTRTGLGDDLMHLTRRGRKGSAGMWLTGQTRHELADKGTVREANQLVQSYVDELLAKDVPPGIGREKLKEWAASRGITLPGKTGTVSQIAAGVKAYYAAKGDQR
ncbi:AAA family ATPase [Streptomyces sp. NPDC020681]|uniref:AAA family ATPase n=1 Tax=Streptomyces sp. NPDC020681 TaxID=3365083 RepID=UPI00379B8497